MPVAHLFARLGIEPPCLPQRILIVEDAVGIAERQRDHFLRFGHEVEVLAGVDSVRDGCLIGPTLDLSRTLRIPLDQLDVCFFDHYFFSKTLDGELLTKEVRRERADLTIIAQSSSRSANQRMCEAGASEALRKADLALYLGV